MKHRLQTVSDAKILSFPHHVNDTGELSVYQSGTDVPMDILRVFSVRAKKGEQRGHHAHYECSQIVICANGVCEVGCDDGTDKETFLLDSPAKGLLIPPTVWADQTYLHDDTVLVVLTDRVYEAEDYIRDYDDFLAFRRQNEQDETRA